MTPTERAKRSDALYYETVSVNRRVLCDMIANREADLEDARAENEELWASNEHMGLKYMAAMGELGEENEQLKAENAKLRELCGFMLRCMKRNHHCDCCLVNGEYCEISYIESDARELGIEVDE